jgi:hypothetical protein
MYPETYHVPSAPLDDRPVLAATSSIANDLSAAIAAALSKHESSLDPNVIATAIASALTPNLPSSNAVAISSSKLFSQVITDSLNELPPHIIKALKDGLKTYIPLASCTHKSCRTASRTVDTFDNSELSVTDKGEFKVKHKSMNPARDHHITTDEFSQIRENFVRGVRKHLILAGETETGSASANACADMFAAFFSNIASRPDWTEDWSLYRGYLIDCYTAWIARCDDSYGMIFSEVAYEKFKLKSLTPSIVEIVRQQMTDTSNYHAQNNSNGRGRGNGSGTPRGRGRGGFDSSGRGHSFRVRSPTCYLCGGEHHYKEHQGKAKRLIFEDGMWVDKALDNRIICISFNVNPDGCRRKAGTCSYGHTCSLCGDPSHGCCKCNA